ncbi:hypothetical protein TIFTF001_054401 [Ficus carica]|uniref:Uncharacterized protein n=1 Tax=Ficus carica TaxID=3494 RepID=A0AA88EEQ1_FICCA|nr:hypothetical protein TIFTF001_048301 [Ficus carica]GMN73146.1 hypothetical protein TIFTF001_054826 [Ficus carica]GMN73148.1 hypothetical protein TIFTF001_054827 [Ficus carica]GMN74301.1 hypothetical protein TIFTF001_054400 [Ficus carica]GMN74306.1 hypothetical protein TIFTF001_054401 [Ficus carica]
MNLVSNPGWTEEDRKASLAFRGMEEELCIFNRTQGEVARYGDETFFKFCHEETYFQDMLTSRRLVKEARARARCFGIGYLERRIPKFLWYLGPPMYYRDPEMY